MSIHEWRRCEIDGKGEGIVHVPTWTFFRIAGDEATFLRTAEVDGASQEKIEELRAVAAAAFRLVRTPRPCWHPHA